MSVPPSENGPVAETSGRFRITGLADDEERGGVDCLLYDLDEEEPLWLTGTTLAEDFVLATWPGNVIEADMVRDAGSQKYAVEEITVVEDTTLSITRVDEDRVPETITALRREMGDGHQSVDLFRDADGNPLYEVQVLRPTEDTPEDLYLKIVHSEFSFENWFQNNLVNFDESAHHLHVVWPETDYFVFFCVPESTDNSVIRQIRKDTNEHPFPE